MGVTILLVEDDVGEARLAEYALRRGGVHGDLDRFVEVVSVIKEFWFSDARLPGSSRG